MDRRRRIVCLLASVIVLLAQLHIVTAPRCSMCGASCRCASRVSTDSCCVRAVGCGGTASGDAVGVDGPLRAVLAAAVALAPRSHFETTQVTAATLPPQPVRAPLDRPPRISC